MSSRSPASAGLDRSASPPGFAVQLLQASGLPIDRFSFKSIETLNDRAQINQALRERRIAEAHLAVAKTGPLAP